MEIKERTYFAKTKTKALSIAKQLLLNEGYATHVIKSFMQVNESTWFLSIEPCPKKELTLQKDLSFIL